MTPDKESRFCPRAHLKQPLVAEYHHAYAIPVDDLSPAGAFLADELPFSVGQEIHLTIHLTDTEEIEVESVVRRVVRGKGLGVEFVTMSRADADKLKEFFASARASSGAKAMETDGQHRKG